MLLKQAAVLIKIFYSQKSFALVVKRLLDKFLDNIWGF